MNTTLSSVLASARVRTCVRACVRACARVCVCVCVCECECVCVWFLSFFHVQHTLPTLHELPVLTMMWHVHDLHCVLRSVTCLLVFAWICPSVRIAFLSELLVSVFALLSSSLLSTH